MYMNKSEIFIVLRSGGDFNIQHVLRLYTQLVKSKTIGRENNDRRVVLLTDINNVPKFPGLVCKYNKNLGPRWWGKIEALGLCSKNGMWLVDLDTTIFRFPNDPERSTFNSDFYNPGRYGSGFCYLTKEDATMVYEQYLLQGAANVQEKFSGKVPELLGDQAFIASVLGERDIFDENVVCSYKKHVRDTGRVKKGVDVVCFHGRPRPWSIPELKDPLAQRRDGP